MDSNSHVSEHGRPSTEINEDIGNFKSNFQEQSLRDNKSLIIVEREGQYDISGDTEAKNVYLYKGRENHLKISRVYSTEWLCNYEMINYPFDTQHCPMILTPTGISKTFLKLFDRNHIYSGPTELTQYFVR